MPIHCLASLALIVLLMSPSAADAQRVGFERSFASRATHLDIETDRGRIEVIAAGDGRIEVDGMVTVRAGWNVPANAMELARAVAANPPIEEQGHTVRIRIPSDGASRRALTLSYRVHVPAGTTVRSVSSSGATSVRGVKGRVTVRTQSGAIALAALADVDVASGSGAITVDGVSASLRAESRSSAFRLQDVHGALTVATQSGRVEASGVPGPWTISTGSGSVHLRISGPGCVLDASSRSGSIHVDPAIVDGTVEKRRIKGRVGEGGPPVEVRTGSGAIHVEAGAR